jgi:hypothetical protein
MSAEPFGGADDEPEVRADTERGRLLSGDMELSDDSDAATPTGPDAGVSPGLDSSVIMSHMVSSGSGGGGGGGGGGGPPQNTSMRNLCCAWAIGFLTAIEGTIIVPSLWFYIKSLGGTHHHYGLAISGFAVFRLGASPPPAPGSAGGL